MDDHYIGCTIGNCILKEKIGRGAYGIVYKARYKNNESRAVKLVSLREQFMLPSGNLVQVSFEEVLKKCKEDQKETESVRRFVREGERWKKIKGSEIVAIHETGFCQAGSEPFGFIVMEYVDGFSLEKWLEKNERFPCNQNTFDIMIALCRGLQSIHQEGIVHRDIKPDNILLDQANHVKICDFGLAKFFEETGLTKTGQIVGTSLYMAPELWDSTKGKIGNFTDIYCMGGVFYKMLTGQCVFKGTNPQLGFAHCYQTPVPLKDIISDIPSNVEKVVLKMLEKKPEKRYQSADEIIEDIHKKTAKKEGFFKAIASMIHPDPTPKTEKEDKSIAQEPTEVLPPPPSEEIEPMLQKLCPRPMGFCNSCCQKIDWSSWQEEKSVLIPRGSTYNLEHWECFAKEIREIPAKVLDKEENGTIFYWVISQNKPLQLNQKNPFGDYFLIKAGTDAKPKVLFVSKPMDPANSPDFKKVLLRIRRGLSLISNLDERWIVKPGILQKLENKGKLQLCYDMPYIPACNLKQILKEKKSFGWQESLPVLYNLAAALEELHSHDLVHREIKPDYILCAVDGRSYLTGFHLTKHKQEKDEAQTMDYAVCTLSAANQEFNLTTRSIGTPDYMSPEQISEAAFVSEKADVWSWAVVALEMLTGQNPFHRKEHQAVFRAITDSNFTQIKESIPESVPKKLVEILKKCLEHDAEKRLSSSKLRKELQGCKNL